MRAAGGSLTEAGPRRLGMEEKSLMGQANFNVKGPRL